MQAGSDSLDAILKSTPPGTRREDFLSGNAVADGAMDAWKRAIEDVFGAVDIAGGPREARSGVRVASHQRSF